MDPGDVFLMIQPVILLAFLLIGWRWSIPRRNHDKTATHIIAANPDAVLCDEILPLQSTWRSGKQREIDRRVHEMQTSGWTFLTMSEVSPWISLRFWGGAVRLRFIQTTTPTLASGEPR